MTNSVNVKFEIESNQSGRFYLNVRISDEVVNYTNAQEALRSPLASKIFGFPWTSEVKVAPEYLCVAKQDWVGWEVLAEPLSNLIKEHVEMALDQGTIEENPPEKNREFAADLSDPQAQRVQEIIETEINPQVASHGGHITLVGVKDDVVYIRMGGGCQGCSQSSLTLREGVVTTIRNAFPEILDVVDVTDHASGENPYF
ncbi:MAG: NifU family protein [Pseudomonadota bacterium]|nr:NifU family protein [Pseudomonadota bacterium]